MTRAGDGGSTRRMEASGPWDLRSKPGRLRARAGLPHRRASGQSASSRARAGGIGGGGRTGRAGSRRRDRPALNARADRPRLTQRGQSMAGPAVPIRVAAGRCRAPLLVRGQCGMRRSKKDLTRIQNRCTQNTRMGLGPAWCFRADIGQLNPGSRANAAAPVLFACFACIGLHLRKTLLAWPRAARCRDGGRQRHPAAPHAPMPCGLPPRARPMPRPSNPTTRVIVSATTKRDNHEMPRPRRLLPPPLMPWVAVSRVTERDAPETPSPRCLPPSSHPASHRLNHHETRRQ